MREGETYLLGTGSEKDRRAAKELSSLRPHRLWAFEEIAEAFVQSTLRDRWIALRGPVVTDVAKASALVSKPLGVLLILGTVRPETVPVLTGRFDRVLVSQQPGSSLPLDEMAEVFRAENREELFIGGSVDKYSRTVVLWRGDGTTLVVPMSAFKPSGAGIKPDFDRFAVADYGHTLEFGPYEASADAVLYEFDPQYRRRLRARRRNDDKGFGPALRRLRKQKGLLRGDFPPLSEKTLARIERGEVGKPHGATLTRIAGRLGVAPEEIETF